MRIMALGVLLIFAGGCESLKDRAKYLTGPEAFNWQGDNRFVVTAKKDMWGQVDLYDGKLNIFAWKFPPGTKFTMGPDSATVDNEGHIQFGTTPASLLGATKFGNFTDTKIEDMVLTIEPPGGKPIPLKVPAKNTYGLSDVLSKITTGPVRFGDEPATDGPIRNIVWLDSGSDNVVLGQRPALFKDIDALAVLKRLDGPKKTCTGYTGDDKKPAPDVILTLRPTEATVYARRTGKVIGTKTFPADDTCPTYASGAKDALLARDSSIPKADVVAWFESNLTGGQDLLNKK